MGKPMNRLRVLVTLLMMSASGLTQAKETLDVVFLNPGFEHGFWGNVKNTMEAAADDLSINLEVLTADRDRIKMLKHVRNIADRDIRPDYAVIVNELQQGALMAEILDNAGVPYLFLLNRLAPDKVDELRRDGKLERYLGSVTPNNHETGYKTASALINARQREAGASKEISILALLGDTATPAAIEREAGMRQAVAEVPNAKILRAFSVDWLFERAKVAVKQFLLRSDADIIWTASGPIAFGAIEAVTEAGLTPGEDVRFAGVGWFPSALDAVAGNTMVMTYGGYFISGAWSMVVLRDTHDGIDLENQGEITAPLTEVNADNIKQFQTYIRDVDWSIVDFSRFLRFGTDVQQYNFSADTLLRNIASFTESAECSDC